MSSPVPAIRITDLGKTYAGGKRALDGVSLEVRQGEDLLFTLQAGISISEDPVFRFAYRPNGQPIHVRAEDTEGNRWNQTFEAVNG